MLSNLLRREYNYWVAFEWRNKNKEAPEDQRGGKVLHLVGSSRPILRRPSPDEISSLREHMKNVVQKINRLPTSDIEIAIEGIWPGRDDKPSDVRWYNSFPGVLLAAFVGFITSCVLWVTFLTPLARVVRVALFGH